MKDKYNDFEGEIFKYSFPLSFVKRNKNYLKKRYIRIKKQDFMSPLDKDKR